MGSTKVAVVTGSNKGIGFAIVRGLCKQFNGTVYLTARNEQLGLAAVKELEKEGLKPKFHQLDITDKNSISKFATYIKEKYGGLDLLVNNAGFAFKVAATEPFSEQAEVSLNINYWGTQYVCDAFFPILRDHARVVNVSSFVSKIALDKCSDKLKAELLGLKTIGELNTYMKKFVDAAKNNCHEKDGWPSSAYGISKTGVTLMSMIQQVDLDKDKTKKDIIVNACCPGYVDTDMSSHKGTKTIDEGADTPLYLALLPANSTDPRGKFVSDRLVKPF